MKTAGGYSPTERLLLIQGWAAVTEDGTELESGTDNFDIIGIAVGVVEGRLVQTPLLVVGGGRSWSGSRRARGRRWRLWRTGWTWTGRFRPRSWAAAR
jgi:hypothetical protein